MYIDRTAVLGRGTLHHIAARHGARFALLIDADSNRRLFIYDDPDFDVPAYEIMLEVDEADQLAEILHSRPIVDRLLSLERQVDELIGERRQ